MGRGDKIRIFVVEDHRSVAKALKGYLEVSGFSVDLAYDMKSALERAVKSDFDVLLCDLHLPDGTGWELLGKLKQRKPEVCALAYSVTVHVGDVERSRAAGFLDQLSKTIAPAELVAALRCAAQARAKARDKAGGNARRRGRSSRLQKIRLFLLLGSAVSGAGSRPL